MSVYPQSVYGQPPYGAVPGYPPSHLPTVRYQQYYQPPPPPQQPQQQPSPSIYHTDPLSFRKDFTVRLSNLTFNSRIHIQDLSLMAQDHPQFANDVAQCINQHVRQVPSWMKLPGFYLFDAIAKNVYDAYAAVFSPIVVSLFIDTYFQVDASTQHKMEEMLLTWRTAGPDYTEIFGSDNQLQLQTAVWGDQSVASKAQVLSELQFTLGQMERALQAHPSDRGPEGHIHVLRQLKRLVERGVSQGELRQILDQLRSLARSALPPPIVRPNRPPAQYGVSFPQQRIRPPYSQSPPAEAPSYVTPVDPAAPTSVPSANLQNLFASLVNAGLLQSTSTSTSESAVVPALVKEPTPIPEDDVELQTSATHEYRAAMLADVVKLTTADLARAIPRVIDYLYDRQGLQCRQCGIRFAETKLGKKRLDDHLDMHFRQNSKVDQGRGHSRSWLISLEDWVHDVSGDGKGKGRGNCLDSDVKSNSKTEAELRGQHVVVPPGAEAQTISCPICKEPLKSEFLEDDEEWVWRNAVKRDDKTYHATCHAEALASTSSLAARLRTEKGRSATPEVQAMSGVQSTLRSTTPPSQLRISKLTCPPQISSESKVAGIKRKVEHTESNLVQEATGTPPHKKVALPTVTLPTS